MSSIYIIILIFILLYSRRHWTYQKNKNLNPLFLKRNNPKRKIMISLIVALSLFLQPFAPILDSSKLIEDKQQSVEAATLAEVRLLENVDVDATLNEDETSLNLILTGNGIADVELLKPEKTTVFYAPDLAGQMTENGPATVQVEILPITLPEDSVLGGLVGELTELVTRLVGEIVVTVAELLNNPLTGILINVQGLDEVEDALDNLNNLNTALSDLATYVGQEDVVIDERGYITVEFSEGLGSHLDGLVNNLLVDTLTELLDAIENLKIGGIIGGVLELLLGDLIDTVIPNINEILDALGDGTVNLANDLAMTQVMGETSISLSVNVAPAVEGEVFIAGTVLNIDSATIDLELLSNLESTDTVSFSDTTAPDAPILNYVYQSDTVVTGRGEPNTTVYINIEGENVIYDGVVDKNGDFSFSDLSLKPGTTITAYLKDTAGNQSESTVTTVIEEKISFDVPDNIAFEPTAIDGEIVRIPREDSNWTIEVEDTRRPGKPFQVMATISEPLTSSNGKHHLPDALVFVNQEEESEPLTETPLEVFAGESGEDPNHSLSWEPNQGVMIEVNTENVYATDYSTTITWTLTDAP